MNDLKKHTNRLILLCGILVFSFLFAGCSSPSGKEESSNAEPSNAESSNAESSEYESITVSSDSLHSDGTWDTAICSEKASVPGDNQSPQLSFDRVDGAGQYAVYMIDLSADNWIHWIAKAIPDTTISKDAPLDESIYVGPYPPSGTHEYKVLVYALKTAPDEWPGTVDQAFSSEADIDSVLDKAGGTEGNILGKGSVNGTVSAE